MNRSVRIPRLELGLLRFRLGSPDPLESSVWFNLVIRFGCPHTITKKYCNRNTLKSTPLFINLINQIIHNTTLTQPNSNLFLTKRDLMPVRLTAERDHAQRNGFGNFRTRRGTASIVGNWTLFVRSTLGTLTHLFSFNVLRNCELLLTTQTGA